MHKNPLLTTKKIKTRCENTLGTPPCLSHFSICQSTDQPLWYLFGGRRSQKRGFKDEDAFKTLYEYDPHKKTFKILSRNPKMITERYWSTMVYRSNGPGDPSLIVFGGFCCITMNGYQELTITEEMFEFKLIKKKWKRLVFSNPPCPLAAHTSLYQRKLDEMIVFGGSCRLTSDSGDAQFTTFDIYRCDFKKENWTQVDYHRERRSQVVPPVRYGHTMNWVNDFLQSEFIIFGGSNMEQKMDYNDIWVYHISKNEWIRIDDSYSLTPVPSGLSDSATSLDSTFSADYAYKLPDINATNGGFSSPNGNETPRFKRKIPPARRFHSSCVVRLRLFIFGGINSKNSQGITRTRSYNSSTNLTGSSNGERKDGNKQQLGVGILTRVREEKAQKSRRRSYFNDLWCFNIVTKKWNQIILQGESVPRPVCGTGGMMGIYVDPKLLWTILFTFGGDTIRGSSNKLYEYDVRLKCINQLHYFNPSTLYELDETKMWEKERIWNRLKRRLQTSENTNYGADLTYFSDPDAERNPNEELELEMFVGLQDQFDKLECYECSVLDSSHIYPIYRKGELYMTPTHLFFYSEGLGDCVLRTWDYMRRIRIIEEIVEEVGEFPLKVSQRRKLTFIMKAVNVETTLLSQLFSTSSEDDQRRKKVGMSGIREMLDKFSDKNFERKERKGNQDNESFRRNVRRRRRKRKQRRVEETGVEVKNPYQFNESGNECVTKNKSGRLVFSDFSPNAHNDLVDYFKSLSLGIIYINRGYEKLRSKNKRRMGNEKTRNVMTQVNPRMISGKGGGGRGSVPQIVKTSASMNGVNMGDNKKRKKKTENKNYWKQEKESLIRSLNAKSFEIQSVKNEKEALKKEMREIDIRMKKVLTKLTSELNEKKRKVETLGSRNHQVETMISQLKKEKKLMMQTAKETNQKTKKLEISKQSLTKKLEQMEYINAQRVKKYEAKIEGLERKLKNMAEEHSNLKSSLRDRK